MNGYPNNMRKYLGFFSPTFLEKKTPKRCRLHGSCVGDSLVHFQGIAMGLVSLLVTPTRFIPPKQWNSLREYSRDGWVVTRWTLRWVFRDRGPVGAPCWWKQHEFQARTKKAFFQCEEFWNSLDIFQERWQSKEKIDCEKIGRFVFHFFSEGMIPGSSLHVHGVCFF